VMKASDLNIKNNSHESKWGKDPISFKETM
jgi:hypothetical protein